MVKVVGCSSVTVFRPWLTYSRSIGQTVLFRTSETATNTEAYEKLTVVAQSPFT